MSVGQGEKDYMPLITHPVHLSIGISDSVVDNRET